MIESGIFIQYKKLKSINSILEDLFYIGWNLNDYGEITYLPIGDTLFFWEHLPLSAIKDIETIIETKQSKGFF